jgi:hypothetical protein
VAEGKAARVVKTYPVSKRDDSSLLEEMNIRPRLRQKLMDRWQGDVVELGGGLTTLTREQLEAVTDEQLLEWGLTAREVGELRRAMTEAVERESYR